MIPFNEAPANSPGKRSFSPSIKSTTPTFNEAPANSPGKQLSQCALFCKGFSSQLRALALGKKAYNSAIFSYRRSPWLIS